jgi:hypothetical protein
MKQFNPRMKVRLIINGVSIYTTVEKIRYGIGDFYKVNAATQKCLLCLEDMQKDNIPPVGLAGTWENMQVQIDKM